MPSISLLGTSVSRCSRCAKQYLASLGSILVNPPSLQKALTKHGALRSAESNVLYFHVNQVRAFGIGVRFSFASVMKAKEPSAPHNTQWVKAVIVIIDSILEIVARQEAVQWWEIYWGFEARFFTTYRFPGYHKRMMRKLAPLPVNHVINQTLDANHRRIPLAKTTCPWSDVLPYFNDPGLMHPC